MSGEARVRSLGIMMPLLLAVATIASTATKIRMPGVPVGIGEVLLLACVVTSALIRAFGGGFNWKRGAALQIGVAFLLLVTCALVAGAMLAQVTGIADLYDTRHEAQAWVFVIALLYWFLLESGLPEDVDRFLRAFAVFGTLAVVMLLTSAVLSRALIGSDWFWYFGLRFAGWSTNPNQLALLLAPLPFLAVHFKSQTREKGWRVLWTIGISLTFVAGVATQSDALWASWIACGMVALLWRWGGAAFGRYRTVSSMVSASIVVPLVLVSAMVVSAPLVQRFLDSVVEGRVNEGGQAGIRVSLWRNGLSAALQSPFFGWGPGSHSGVAQSFQGVESHNTYIDLATQAGLPASAALLTIVGLSVVRQLRRGTLQIGLAVAATASFAGFHNCLRHPVFWFMVFGAIAAAGGRVRGRARRTVEGQVE